MTAGIEDIQIWLETVFCETQQSQCVASDLVKKWAQAIDKRYKESWRYYHNLTHISDMMGHFNRWKDIIRDKPAIILAILFHDIIYDPESTTNETDSVDVFKEFLAQTSIEPALSDRVTQLITATITHLNKEAMHDADMDFFLDFDMAILGQSEEEYKAYADAIRKEYGHFDDSTYCAGRTKVLQTFLERPRIFATQEFWEMYEPQARKNLKHEIERLASKS